MRLRWFGLVGAAILLAGVAYSVAYPPITEGPLPCHCPTGVVCTCKTGTEIGFHPVGPGIALAGIAVLLTGAALFRRSQRARPAAVANARSPSGGAP